MTNPTTTESSPESIAEELMGFIAEGGTLKTLKDIPSKAIEGGYATALGFYESGRQQDAEKLFQLLCLLDHYDPRFFMGLGACRQQLGQYEQAIESFSYAGMLDCNDPRPPFYSAECHLALGNVKEAESGFYAASHFEGGGARFDELRQKARAVYGLMQKKKGTDATANDNPET